MAFTQLYYPPTQNGLQKTLGAALDEGTTSALTLNNVTGIQDAPGVIVINRIDSDGNEKTASAREYISYTGVSGSTLTTLTRGLAETSDQDHAISSVVEFIPDITAFQALIDFLDVEHTPADGTHDATKVMMLAGNQTATGIKTFGSGKLKVTDLTVGSYTVTPPSATDTLVAKTTTDTLTNKRVTPRVTTITSSATPTINTDNCDFVNITALAAAVTSMTTNLSGTPTNGQKLIIRFKDDGTGRAITWGTGFEACGVALPTTTTASKRLTVGFIYDTTTSKWGCVAKTTET